MAVEELLQYLPPEVIYHHVPLKDGENAFGPWREGLRCLVEPSADDKAWERLNDPCSCSSETDEGEGECGAQQSEEEDLSFVFPVGEDGQRIRQLLEANRRALELFEEGVRRGKLQIPGAAGADPKHGLFEFGPEVRSIAELWRARAKALAADGQFHEAAQDLICILRMGEMLCTGDCFIIQYMVGIPPQRIAISAMRAFAAVPGVPTPALEELYAAVERHEQLPNCLAHYCRVELCCYYLPQLDRLPDSGSVETLVDALLKESGQSPAVGIEAEEPALAAKREAVLTRHRQRLLFLLEGHPHPFDKAATARVMG